MGIKLMDINEDNFFQVINLKSDPNQEKDIQIFERWVGSNTFFLATCQVFGFTPKAIYDGQQLIGFTSFGYRKEKERYELISIMLGHAYQGKGYATPVITAVIDEMIRAFDCKEIYLSVIHNNERAIHTYKKIGFKLTGEVEQGHHPEPIYCLAISEYVK